MERDTENSIVQGSKDSRKGKGIQKKKLSDTQCKSNINAVAEDFISSENIHNYNHLQGI